jgi:hypothetical protein
MIRSCLCVIVVFGLCFWALNGLNKQAVEACKTQTTYVEEECIIKVTE